MHKLFLLLLFAVLITLGGCQTVKGIGEDISNTWSNLKEADAQFQEDWW